MKDAQSNRIWEEKSPHTRLPWGRENSTFLGSFWGFLPEIPIFRGALTAFRDSIQRFPWMWRFSSWPGASFTSHSMETTSELLWFCKGKGGKIPPGCCILPWAQIPTSFKFPPPFSPRNFPVFAGFCAGLSLQVLPREKMIPIFASWKIPLLPVNPEL